MYVRLAFAVAAHLNPEILIVDEVLAVGDAQFQKKCLGKMKQVSEGDGKTVLFVSHNMAAVQALCTRGIMLYGGRVVMDGTVTEVVHEYSKTLRSDTVLNIADRKDRQGRGRAKITRMWFEDELGRTVISSRSGRPAIIALEYTSALGTLNAPRASVAVTDGSGQPLFVCSTELTGTNEAAWPGSGILRCTIPRLPLSGSEYLLNAYLEAGGITEDYVVAAASLAVEDDDFYGHGKLYPAGWQGKGVLVKHEWSVSDVILSALQQR
jgi:lipopolysaccharide transport system ATP-binding protein